MPSEQGSEDLDNESEMTVEQLDEVLARISGLIDWIELS